MAESRRLVILLGLLIGVAGTAIFFRPTGGAGEKPPAHRASNATQAAARVVNALQPSNTEVHAAANPFLPPDREKKPAKVEPPVAKSGVEMVGWAKLNDVEYALVALNQTERYVRVGDELAGWRVQKVTPEELVLVQGSKQEVVKLTDRFSVTPLSK